MRRRTRLSMAPAFWVSVLCLGALSAEPPSAQRPIGSVSPASIGRVDAQRLANVGHEPEQWLLSGRDLEGSYFSPLTQINRTNAGQLGFAWDYKMGSRRGLEATPLVVDGVMYAAGNWGRVYSLDAASGRELWTYDPQIDGQWGRYACCDAVNRGLAVWKGRVYVGSLDGYLHAIDAATGKRLWKVDTLIDRKRHLPYTSPGAPVVAGDVVVIGNAGSDFKGVRGYVSAYDLDTGSLRWRFYTVPRDPKLGPQDQPHLRKAITTWDPRHRWEYGGGGNVWDGIAYDPQLGLVYVGTGNVSPYTIKEDGRKGGDDLYVASIIAIHAADGSMAWYYQVVPGDEWDYDSTQKFILSELTIGGIARRVLLQASKNGFIYVLDRASGELISASAFAYFNWTKGLDPKTGRPISNPAAEYLTQPSLIYPSMAGAHSWQPMAYSPDTGLLYIPVQEAPMVYIETAHRPAGLIEGNFTVAGLYPEDYDPAALKSLYGTLPSLQELATSAPAAAPRSLGVLKAWDPVRRRLAWERPLNTFWNGGVLATAGGLTIQGDATGYLNVFDAKSGTLLKRIEVGTSIMAAAMTYQLRGVQYISVMAGYGGGPGLYAPYPKETAAYKYDNEGRIITLRLGGGAVPKPPLVRDVPFERPPPRAGSDSQINRGAILYNRFCSRCHAFGRGELPDLRRVASMPAKALEQIVRGGSLAASGMGSFADVLSTQDLMDIRDHLLDQAWDAYVHQDTHSH